MIIVWGLFIIVAALLMLEVITQCDRYTKMFVAVIWFVITTFCLYNLSLVL